MTRCVLILMTAAACGAKSQLFHVVLAESAVTTRYLDMLCVFWNSFPGVDVALFAQAMTSTRREHRL